MIRRPIAFGDDGNAIFGMLHLPEANVRDLAVLLCPPPGYEGICAFPTLRALAERLAAAGFPVLRFDWHGTGDSSGHDEDPERIPAALRSAEQAAAALRRATGISRIAVFGVRLGATLAALVAPRLGANAAILWAPVTKGRAYVREQRAFRRLAEAQGEMETRRPADDPDDESAGFLFSGATLAALGRLDLTTAPPPAPRIWWLERDDLPGEPDLWPGMVRARIPGYAGAMDAPHRNVPPEALFRAVEDALVEISGRGTLVAEVLPATATVTQGSRVVRQTALPFAERERLLGVLTEPMTPPRDGRPPLLFLDTAGNHRVGPARMYVHFARDWAAEGWTSLRIDQSGVGDGHPRRDERVHPYSPPHVDDVRAAIDLLVARGHERVVLVGLCSGAYVAWHTLLRDPRVAGAMLLNLQLFTWREGVDSLEVSALRQRIAVEAVQRSALDPSKWRKLLQGGIDRQRLVRAAGMMARVVGERARHQVLSAIDRTPLRRLREGEHARALRAVVDRGARLLFLFAGGDPGLDNLREHAGATFDELRARGDVRFAIIDGTDHSFTPLWAQRELGRTLREQLRWWRGS